VDLEGFAIATIGHAHPMIRRMFRQVGAMAMATFLWQHRGSVLRAIDLVQRAPQLLSARRGAEALTEAKAIVALDGAVPTSTDIRITGISDGAVLLRGDPHGESLDVARRTLLGVGDVLDVRTDGTDQPTVEDVVATAGS
jgi:hypothetical protein